jgi:hypothetical protein
MGVPGWMAGCADPPAVAPLPTPPPPVVMLEPADQLLRASMALRGIRPSVEELEAVRQDPGAYERFVDAYVESEQFGSVIKDLHAELYLIRTDTEQQLPVTGIVADRGFDQGDVYDSTIEAPLNFVADVVMSGRPYTEILTSPLTLADSLVADIYGLEFDPAGPPLQYTSWSDGRPPAGILSDSQILRRHVSNAANFNRARANFVTSTFLCEDIAGRDVVIEGGIDINDPTAVATALYTNDGCVGCHSTLDPLAAFFWGYMEKIGGASVVQAYRADCVGNFFPDDPLRGGYDLDRFCYPLRFYDQSESDLWVDFDLRPPAFFGTAGETMTDLGQLVTADPRFSMCTARTFFGWLSEVGRDEVPLGLASDLQQVFVDSGYSAKQLAKAVVMSEPFRTLRAGPDDFVPGLQTVRPEQYSRTVEDLTGFRWLSNQDPGNCDDLPNSCWGTVELTTSDLFGFRSMSGGVDGVAVTHATHTATPTKVLAMARIADEAAGWVVRSDFSLASADRRLLWAVEPATVDEPTVRAQLEWLHLRILGEFVAPDSAELDATYALWSATESREGAETAWKVIVSAMLQDVRMVYY